jgi:hypothetical protein
LAGSSSSLLSDVYWQLVAVTGRRLIWAARPGPHGEHGATRDRTGIRDRPKGPLLPCTSHPSPIVIAPISISIISHLQRQRSQNLTSASGDAIWGAHRPIHNYIHGQFGGILFCPPGTPAPPVHPRGNFYQTDFSRLSLAPCCAGQPSFGHIQAAPRRALLPLESSPGLVLWPVSVLDFLLVGS